MAAKPRSKDCWAKPSLESLWCETARLVRDRDADQTVYGLSSKLGTDDKNECLSHQMPAKFPVLIDLAACLVNLVPSKLPPETLLQGPKPLLDGRNSLISLL